MALDPIRSAFNLGGAAALIVGASLGIQGVANSSNENNLNGQNNTTSTGSVKKCTCTNKGELSGPPCYTCTFNLHHAPPAYQSNFKTKSMKLSEESTALTYLPHSSQVDNLNSTLTEDLDNSNSSRFHETASLNDGFANNNSVANNNINCGTRPKLFPKRINQNNNHEQIPEQERRCLGESASSNTLGTERVENSIEEAEQMSPVRERLGSITAYESVSVDSDDVPITSQSDLSNPAPCEVSSSPLPQDNICDSSSQLVDAVNLINDTNDSNESEFLGCTDATSVDVLSFGNEIPQELYTGNDTALLTDNPIAMNQSPQQTQLLPEEENREENKSPLPSLMIIPQ